MNKNSLILSDCFQIQRLYYTQENRKGGKTKWRLGTFGRSVNLPKEPPTSKRRRLFLKWFIPRQKARQPRQIRRKSKRRAKGKGKKPFPRIKRREGLKMKVYNMTSNSTGREVANQFIIEDGGKIYFQSYSTIIAVKEAGKITIDNNAENYSRTTSKYLYQFLNTNRKNLLQDVKEGRIIRANLNA